MSYTVLDIEATGLDPWRDRLLAVGLGSRVYTPDEGNQMVRLAMSRPGTVLVAHTNFDLRWFLLNGATLGEGVSYHDTKVMAWLDDASQELGLEPLAKKYLGVDIPKPITARGGVVYFQSEALDALVPIEDVPWAEMVAYNQSDIDTEAALYEALRDALKRKGLWHMFLAEEAPFSRLLIEMEATGMPFDAVRASALLAETGARLEALRTGLVRSTGAIDFNPGSGDQVARFLYTELWSQPVKFPIPRLVGMEKEEKRRRVAAIAPKGVRVERVGREYAYGTQFLDGRGLAVPNEKHPGLRPTVSSKVLNVLYGDDPWVANYVEWRKADKLRGYLVDWLERVHDGRLYGRFDQSGTITGRLAAREPNLQQVAKESDVRDLFRGPLVVGDYAGLEARLAAHFSGDPVMLDIFRSGKDLYGTLAARAWGGEEVKEHPQRDVMKVVWLASQYGAKGETLAQAMAQGGIRGYDGDDANTMLKDMMKAVPRMFAWRNEVIEQARIDGFVTTLGGRRRQLADIDSAHWQLAYKAERQAVNSKVQGSAADVVRRAMLGCRRVVPTTIARICLQVHDEIHWLRGPDFDSDWFDMIKDVCENGTFDLDVPLVFEAKVAESWAAK